jgi:hypothetical protein
MKNIHKFIDHIIGKITLNEAIAPKIVDQLIKKFREEANDFNIDITDDQLKKYIEAFDNQFKNSPKVSEKDLFKYSLPDLIRIVTSKKSSATPEEESNGEDIAYEDNNIIIYTGNTEERCVTYGKGEKWCIGRGNFPSYRKSSSYNYKHFYLVYNQKKSANDPKSAYVIHVDNRGDYCYTLRPNNGDNCGNTWDEIVEEFPELEGKQKIFKYYPISKEEEKLDTWRDSIISFREWSSLSYNDKKNYLVTRLNVYNISLNNTYSRDKELKLFNDISNYNFVEKYLPKLDQSLIDWIVETNALPSKLLLLGYDNFKPSNQRSLIKNLREENYFNLNDIINNDYSWELRKKLVELGKIKTDSDLSIVLSEENKTIIVINTSKKYISIDLITQNDYFKNIKINERTEKYLYNNINNIPSEALLSLASSGKLTKDFNLRIIDEIKEDKNTLISGNILINYNDTLPKSFEILENGTSLREIPLKHEDVYNLFKKGLEEDKNNLYLFLMSLLKIMLEIFSIESKTYYFNYNQQYNLVKDNLNITLKHGGKDYTIYCFDNVIYGILLSSPKYSGYINSSNIHPIASYNIGGYYIGQAYCNYRKSTNQPFSDEELRVLFGQNGGSIEFKKGIAEEGVIMNPGSNFSVRVIRDNIVLQSLNGPSLAVSPRSGKLIKAQSVAGGNNNNVQNNGGRRGRPAGGGRERDYNNFVNNGEHVENLVTWLTNAGMTIPRNSEIFRDLNRAGQLTPAENDRGASRRNNMLQGTGGYVTEIGLNGNGATIYMIRLGNVYTASIVIQPGNKHYVVTSNGVTKLNSPSDLFDNLRNQHLLENNDKLNEIIRKIALNKLKIVKNESRTSA